MDVLGKSIPGRERESVEWKEGNMTGMFEEQLGGRWKGRGRSEFREGMGGQVVRACRPF